jgi:hypothetical protein
MPNPVSLRSWALIPQRSKRKSIESRFGSTGEYLAFFLGEGATQLGDLIRAAIEPSTVGTTAQELTQCPAILIGNQ